MTDPLSAPINNDQAKFPEGGPYLRVISSMAPKGGGPAQGIRNSIPAQLTLGHRTEVSCLDDPTCEYGCVDSFPIHKIGQGTSPWHYHRNFAPWLANHVYQYEAVIIHGLWQYASYAVTRQIDKLRKTGRPVPRVYVMPHGMLDPWFQKNKTRRVKALRNWFYWKLLEWRTIQNADGLLFTCQKELELARVAFHPYNPKQEINVGYGVAEPPTFNDQMQAAFIAACPRLGPRSYLLFLSRIHPKKGIDLLINAYAQLLRDCNRRFNIPTLVIAGPMDSTFAQSMQQLAGRHGLLDKDDGPAIYFTGMLQGDAKWGAFYGCEAFVLPSHQENFGIAVVEALACGKPVLLSDQVNIASDIVADGAAIAAEDTANGTRHMLYQWFSMNVAKRSRLACAATKCYRKRYLPTAAARVFLSAIQSANLSRKSCRHPLD